MSCGPLCRFIFPQCVVQCSFSCDLDSKFCLHAAGGIYVEHNFAHLEGNIKFQGRPRSYTEVQCSGVPLGSLAGF